MLELGQEGLASAAKLDFLEVAPQVKDAVGQGLFVGQRSEHAMLDGVFGNEVDDGHGSRLVLPPRACDPLF